MKKLIELFGNSPFVLTSWSILTLACYTLYKLSLLTHNVFIAFGLSFLLFFGSMAYGFFYFQVFPNHRLWADYYKKKSIENDLVYKLIGVEIFRRILIKSPFRKLNQRVYLRGRKEYIGVFFEETKRSETSHLMGLFIGLIFNFLFLNFGYNTIFLFSIFFNILMNLYPIFLQRYNRNIRIKQ